MKILQSVMIIVGLSLMMGLPFGLALAKETTSLDEALDRPVKVEKFVDKENGVACYWNNRHPQHLSCVQVENPSWTKRVR